MTLQSVAARIRAEATEADAPWWYSGDVDSIVEAFEADPEFTAPERLKAAEAKLAKVAALLKEEGDAECCFSYDTPCPILAGLREALK